LALAIALGWSLFQLASGVSDAVSTLLTGFSNEAVLAASGSEPLTWEVGGRILTLGPALRGGLELAFVLAVAVLVHRRTAQPRHS
jgi:hypothetical protein